MRIRRVACGALFALTLAACSPSPSPVPPPPVPPPPPPKAAAKPAEADVTLQVVKWPELEKAIASHRGKVVVLDVWAEY